MTSVNIKDVLIKVEHDIIGNSNEYAQLLPTYDVTIKQENTDDVREYSTDIKPEPFEPQYEDPGIRDEFQLKQETNDNDAKVYTHFKCEYCSEMFTCSQSLIKHIERHVLQQSCKACYVVLQRTNLNSFNKIKMNNNVKSTQVKRKSNIQHKHVCHICNKSFQRISVLKRHERDHTDIRPYVCYVCNKSFKHSSVLKLHQLVHTNERPYVCNICNKSFKHSTHLVHHELTHTNERPHVCRVCNKRFTQSSNLKTHQLTHTNDRPHICNVCSKSFTLGNSLKLHLRTHTNERPYVCKICNKSFKQSSHLITHQVTHKYRKAIDDLKEEHSPE